jgi:hypothetical protein
MEMNTLHIDSLRKRLDYYTISRLALPSASSFFSLVRSKIIILSQIFLPLKIRHNLYTNIMRTRLAKILAISNGKPYLELEPRDMS